MPLSLKNKQSYFIVFGLMLFILSACSLSKNTWSTRAYQSVNTKFNVYFNGMTSYEEGMRNITNANTEDYSSIIPMYAISKHENANSAKSNFDRTIEKCRKAIKLHSIKQKPVRNTKKWSNPDYQLWYKQEEFNPALKDAWMLLAKSEFHKADFLGSVGTFTYITRHYATEKDLVAQSQLWIVRAYAEMGWIYEAEQVLSKIKQDDLKVKNSGLFAAVSADLLLKKKQYKEAIPFLEICLKNESNKVQKQRFTFLLAQLYSHAGNIPQAYSAFSKVIKLNPAFEMDFNARIYRAELDNRDPVAVRKELSAMLKNSNNKDYLDQIYYAIGKTYLNHSDTIKAIENFNLSVEKSTRNGLNKAQALITLGDLYYGKQNYIKAQPCYDEASKIITPTQEDFERVSKRAETLGELVVQHEIVTLQDSLQYLSTLSESERLKIVEKIISKLIEDEKKATELAKEKENNFGNPEDDFNGMPPLIGQNTGKAGDWYFYNPNLVKSGKSDFLKKWGRRKLEDNWRRTSKTASLFAEESTSSNNAEQTTVATDSTTQESTTSTTTDNKSPEFYLNQIPVTPAQIQKSNEEIATALYNMGMIYKDKVEDLPLAIKTFDLFAQRFPTDERRLESYFQSYMLSLKTENLQEAENYKQKLLTDFPKSKYVEVISQPDYFNRMKRMYSEQDSIYSLTYAAYNASDFKTVKKNLAFVQENYPLSTLMPKFMFLAALSTGKTDKPAVFEESLSELVEKYPESDVSAMSKDILALMLQGRESTKGSTHGTLLTRRDNALDAAQIADTKKDYSADKTLKHRLLLIVDTSSVNMNKLLYNVASYNFTRFMVKDFDLVNAKFDSLRNSLSITNFESYDETEWYLNSIEKDPEIANLFRDMNATKIIISEENYGIMRSISNLDSYLAFKDKNLGSKTIQNNKLLATTKKAEPIAIEKDFVENKTISDNKVAETKPNNEIKKTDSKEESKPTVETKTEPTPQQPKAVEPVEEVVPLFKNLFGYRANEPHFISIAVLSGTFDLDKLKTVFNTYNSQNYSMLNLKINTEKVNKMEIVIIGPFADANLAKSYLLRMVKERSLFEPLKGTDYRNLIGSQKNLNIMMQKDAMTTYFEFMQQYYLN